MCFSPKKHKANVVSKVESGLPCKLTKFSFHETEDNVIWVNTATQINDALEATVDFCREPNDNETTVVNTKDLDDIQVYQSITVRGMVLFGDNKAEPVPNKTDLIKKDGSFVDEFGTMPITIWNKQIETVEEGFYEIKNIRLQQFKGEKYISTVTGTVFNKLNENLPRISQQKIKDPKEKLKTKEITSDNIQSVDSVLQLHHLLQKSPISTRFTNA